MLLLVCVRCKMSIEIIINTKERSASYVVFAAFCVQPQKMAGRWWGRGCGANTWNAEHKKKKRDCGYLLLGNWEKRVVESISIQYKRQISSANDLNNGSALVRGQKRRKRFLWRMARIDCVNSSANNQTCYILTALKEALPKCGNQSMQPINASPTDEKWVN